MLGESDGAHLGFDVERIAHLDLGCALGEPFDDGVADGFVDQQPTSCDAGLAGGGEDSGHHPVDGRIDVRVREDDVRGLAAELEGDLRDVVGGALHDRDSGGSRSGEGDLVHAGFGGQRGSCVSGAGDDVEHSRRETGFINEFGELEGRGRRLLRRLGDKCATGGQGGRELACQKEQWAVPGQDCGDHADRLAAGVGEEVRLGCGDGVTENLVGSAGEEFVGRR